MYWSFVVVVVVAKRGGAGRKEKRLKSRVLYAEYYTYIYNKYSIFLYKSGETR